MQRQQKFIVGISVILATVGFLVWTAVDQTKMYMVTVTEFLSAKDSYANTTVRIAGRVGEDSMNWNSESRELRFRLDDIAYDRSVEIAYTGLLPDMFAEGRDVVVQGPGQPGDLFTADTILTSCPSKYEAEVEGHPEAHTQSQEN